MSRKKIKFSTSNAEEFLNSEEAKTALHDRIAAFFPDHDIEDYVKYILEQIAEHPQAADYTEPERLFDELLPQVFHINIVNPLVRDERVIAAEIYVENVKAHIRDALISTMAIDAGYEDAQGNILKPDEWRDLKNEIDSERATDLDVQLMEKTSRNFFLSHAPKLLSFFYMILFRSSITAGLKAVMNAPRNASDVPRRREIEEVAKWRIDEHATDLKTLLKTLLEVKDAGRWPKAPTPEVSPLVDKVEAFLMSQTELAKRGKGGIRFPKIAEIVKEANRHPDLLALNRRTSKKSSRRCKFNSRNLQAKLVSAGFPLKVLKERVRARHSAKIN